MDEVRDPTVEHCERLGTGRPIVVGTDGSSESERGVRYAAELATALGVGLVVVHAMGLIGTGGDWRSRPDDRHADAEELLRGRWTAFLDRDALDVTTEVVDGTGSLGLMRVADDVDASMIVVGSHGSGGSGDPFLGSTSHRIVADSHRPVVVVPPGDNHRHYRPTGAGVRFDSVADTD